MKKTDKKETKCEPEATCYNNGSLDKSLGLTPSEAGRFALELYDRGVLSDQTLLAVFGYDDEMEAERKRYARGMVKAFGYGVKD